MMLCSPCCLFNINSYTYLLLALIVNKVTQFHQVLCNNIFTIIILHGLGELYLHQFRLYWYRIYIHKRNTNGGMILSRNIKITVPPRAHVIPSYITFIIIFTYTDIVQCVFVQQWKHFAFCKFCVHMRVWHFFFWTTP